MNQEFAGRRDFGAILRKQSRGAGVLLDDRGSFDLFPGCERFPAVHGTINGLTVENDGSFSDESGTFTLGGRRQHIHGAGGNSNQVRVHDLQCEIRIVIAETSLMQLVKRVADGCPVILGITGGIDSDRQ